MPGAAWICAAMEAAEAGPSAAPDSRKPAIPLSPRVVRPALEWVGLPLAATAASSVKAARPPLTATLLHWTEAVLALRCICVSPELGARARPAVTVVLAFR